MRDNDAAASIASQPIPMGLNLVTEKTSSITNPVTKNAPTAMTDEIIALTEKVFPRLPERGGVILVGSLTAHDDSPALAGGFAQALQLIAAKSVLLIRFEAAEASGKPNLTDILRGEATLDAAVQTDIHLGLKTLSAPPRTAEIGAFLLSPSFRDFLQNAQRTFPWVILQYPALLHREDVISLISRSDAVIATMRRGEGRRDDVQGFRQLCAQLKTDFLGVALT